MPPPRTNAVAPATSFVGRSRELAAIERLLAEAPIVTLLGPPGTGKSRLALELGLRDLDRWPGGFWIADVSSALTAAEVCAALGRALDVALPGLDAVRAVGRHLAALGRTLVVLDDAEPAAAAVGEVLRALSPAAPDTRWLVTSRVRLGAPGESVLEVEPLPTPADDRQDAPALQLLCDRAAAIGLDLARDPTARADAAELVRRLDGIPLAIELVAPRLRVATPGQLLERVPAQLGLVAHAEPRAARRHATLEDAVRASFTLAGEPARAALAQSAVFADGFDLEAAEAVIALDGGTTVLDALQALRDHSLLWARNAPGAPLRLGSWAVVRDAAESALEASGGRRAAEARHAHHYLARADRARSALETRDEPAARAWLSREHDNLVMVHRRALARQAVEPSAGVATEVLRSAVALDALLEIQGPWSLRATLLETALAAAGPEGDPRARAAALVQRARVHSFGGRAEQAEADLREALSLAERLGDAAAIGRTLDELATQASRVRRIDEAVDLHARALERLREAGDRPAFALCLSRLAWDHVIAGRLDEGERLFAQALSIHREIGNRRREGMTLGELGAVALDRGRLDDARALLTEGLAIDRETGFRPAEAFAAGNLGLVALEEGRTGEAVGSIRGVVEQLRALGNRWWEGAWVGYLAVAHHLAGAEPEAAATYREAQSIDHEVGNFAHEGLMRAFAAALEASRGGHAAARREVAEARRLLAAGGETIFQAAADVCEAIVETAARATSPAEDAPALDRRETRRGREAPALETRLALRLLERMRAAEGEPDDALVVGEAGRWFRPPHGKRVDVGRRGALRRIVDRLAVARGDGGATALTIDDLLAAGWPGERCSPEAGARRVYTALWDLRRIGLAGSLIRRDDGYLIDPAVRVVRSA